MGILVNPDNLAFQVALNSEIYVDKSGLTAEAVIQKECSPDWKLVKVQILRST